MKPHDLEDQTLSAALRAVAEDDERLGSSSAVSMRLLAEVHAVGRARRRRFIATGVAAAAVLAAALAVPVWRAVRPANVPARAELPVQRELVTEFFPLTYSNVPARAGYVVRMQVPRDALASFGVAFDARHGNSPSILADVVIGDDGLARAVRFVRVVDAGQEQTP
jgi:hypothetical protein